MEPQDVMRQLSGETALDRQRFLRLLGAGATLLGTGSLLAACGGDDATTTAGGATAGGGGATGRPIKIGFVSPQTGPLAGFAEADAFVLDGVRTAIGAGVAVGGETHPLEIVEKDSQSSPDRAASVANDLVLQDAVDLVLVGSTPETVNPVADACELNGVPCLSTTAPWQTFVVGRGGDPTGGSSFEWTYHFFWGLEDVIETFLDMWGQAETNRKAGGLWPNDGDGNAWSDPKLGFPAPLEKAGFALASPPKYTNGANDYSAQISAYKSFGAEIVTGVPQPPDFTNFYKQAVQQGFRPRIVSVGKALLFPSSVEALGTLGDGVSSEVWWSDRHPFTSSLTGQGCKEFAAAFESASGRQWTQPLGFSHALFEIAVDALKRAGTVEDKGKIRDAIKATNLDTIVGKVAWGSGPTPNVAKTPLVGGQWQKGSKYPYELALVTNTQVPEITPDRELKLIGA